MHTHVLLAFIALTIFIIGFLFSIFYIRLHNLILSAVRPSFIKIEPSADQFIDLASTIWSLKKNINKIIEENSLEDKKRQIDSSFNKLDTILKLQNIEVKDYTNEKFNEGMNIDIIETIKNPSIRGAYIKETISPTIIHNGIIIKKARVIKEMSEDLNE